MIIKSMARKDPSFGQLVAYMEKDDGDRVVFHNLFGHDRVRREEIVREFEGNAKLLGRRRNGNALYHEILSLDVGHRLDRESARRILSDIGHEYLRRRAPEQIAYGTLHRDTGHLHLHLCISANPLGKTNRARLSKRAFADVQKEVEALVLERYPELNQRALYAKGRGADKVKTTSREQELKERSGAPSAKEKAAGIARDALAEARDAAELDALLAEKGFALYVRGKTAGISGPDGKRHRLSTLGLGLDYSAALERFAAPKDRDGPADERRRRKEALDRAAAVGRAADGPGREL